MVSIYKEHQCSDDTKLHISVEIMELQSSIRVSGDSLKILVS